MEINDLNSLSRPIPQQSNPQAITSDFQAFLKMLTTQMQNQDPLNPIESSDYAVQLATFSNVEQSVKTNQLLEAIQQQFGVMSMSQLAAWVGQEARASGPVLVDGDMIQLEYQVPAAADRAFLVVKDSQNAIVSRLSVDVAKGSLQWLPENSAGAPLTIGLYNLELESYSGEQLVSTSEVDHYARIIEAQGGIGGTHLILEGGVRIAAQDITALRIPPLSP